MGVPRITDEDLVNSAPAVRALLIGRLERLYEPVARALDNDRSDLSPIDPRMMEIGLRICKEEALLYRLDKPPTIAVEDEPVGDGMDKRALVEVRLQEIEDRLRGSKS